MVSKSHASLLNAQQVLLRKMIKDEQQPYMQVKPLLLQQHARFHAAAMSNSVDWSYQDEVLADVPEEWMRIIPGGEDHSIAWLLWHLTRCEDITMNLLVAETDQVLISGGWQEKLNTSWRDTGNAMSLEEITAFSQEINLAGLLSYRIAVGRQTQEIITRLDQASLYRKMNPAVAQYLVEKGAVVEEARGIAEYWSNRDVAGLLLMPATRHILSHLNEALRIKNKIVKENKK